MRIQSSDLALASAHLKAERHATRASLNAWVGERPTARTGSPGAARPSIPPPPPSPTPSRCEDRADLDCEQGVEPRLRIAMMLLERLTGRRIRLLEMDELSPEEVDQIAGARTEAVRPTRAGWGVEFDAHEEHDEVERTEFAAEGVVRTADGREIKVAVGIELERQEHWETNVSIRLGDAVRKDPLVLNFAGTSAQLTDWRFRFDLDADGTDDEIAFAGAGSGFLVLDRNGDGLATDGSELFGPTTGDGFAELSGYDADGNGWIDEADPVFDELAIWTKDGPEGGTLTGLREAGVGAVSLQRARTPFELGSGELVSTGIYLAENGGAGTVQQVDLYV